MEDADQEEAIAEFLEGKLRAGQWREMRLSLEARLRDALANRDSVPAESPARTSLERKIRELREQVAALAQEEAVTQFVEDTVRSSLARSPIPSMVDDEEGYY